MYFSRKIIPLTLVLLGGSAPASLCLAAPYIYVREHDTYSTGDADRVIDESEGRRILEQMPDIQSKDVWFVTGLEDYYKSPACITGRDLYVYLNAMKSAQGIWRGKKYMFTGQAKGLEGEHCDDFALRQSYAWDTATFVDPAVLHPDEDRHGAIPGVFQLHGPLTDEELLKLRDSIRQIHDCLKKGPCPYQVDLQYMGSPAYDYLPAIKPENLLTLGNGDKPGCYSMMFSQNSSFTGLYVMNFCLVSGTISSVHIDDMVTE